MDASPISSKPEVSREEFRDIVEELRELKSRVSALERDRPKHLSEPPPTALPELHLSSDTVPAIGRTLLAIAGAYLLRALTELNVLPVQVGVAAGILYAGFWLWHATQAKGKLPATLNVLSSVFIFAPLVWEATVRMHAVSDWTAAAAIAAFSLAAIWKPRIAMWSCPAGAAIAITLLIATEDVLPFTVALLAIAAGAEFASIRSRWVVAVFVDAAILILIVMAGRSGGLPEGYAPISRWATHATLAALFLIFVGNAAVNTLIRRYSFTLYEIAQTASAIGLAAGGVLYLTKANAAVGIFATIAAAVCYAIALTVRSSNRNIQTYATFAGMLAIGGTFLLFSGVPLAAIWSAVAIGLSWTAFAGVHAPLFLWIAAAISGVAGSAAWQLFGSAGGVYPTRATIIILIGAAVSYLKFSQHDARWPALLIAAVFLWCASGLAASMGAAAVVLIFFAIALAWSGERWKRPELIWLMYLTMTLAGVKILFHDFSRESNMTLVVSLLFYGATMILLPRILKKN